jgi:hypothetical protein
MKNSKVEHTTIRNQNLFCLNCGGEYKLIYPLQVSGPNSLSAKIDAFNALHGNCPPTWKEPEVEQSQSEKEKAMFWIANGEHGSSSMTMWNCLMGNKGFPINHPYDPDDFKRCYKLLKIVPEWRTQLDKMKPLSEAWKNLVENWDKLEAMYEQNIREEWKNYKKVGMYEFMQTLIA